MRVFKLNAAILATVLSVASFEVFAEETVCRGSIGPRQLDNIFVPDGASCTLNGTRAIGTIKVGSNATLLANRVRVNGGLQAQGATQVTVTAGSQFGGSVQIKQGGGASISGTQVGGDLQFDENVLPLSAANNAVGGNIQIMKNFGGVSLTGNIIDGALQCKENQPVPIGSGNVATIKEDQCSAL